MFNFDENTLFISMSILIGITYGVVAQQKQFCFSGGIKDIILFKHTRRTASLIVAITVSLLGTQTISFLYDLDLTQTRYYLDINYLFIIIGGIMFGYGMMISDGCSSRHLIKFSQGDMQSFYILITLGIFAYLTYSLFSIYNDFLLEQLVIQSFSVLKDFEIPMIILLPILLYILYKSLQKCINIFQVLDGVLIGLIITSTWYFTAVLFQDMFIDIQPQSLSFVYPLGKIVQYIQNGFHSTYLIFPVLVVFGVIIGAFISSKMNKQYSKKQMCDNSQQNPPSLFKKLVGAALMGIGGILAVGCTVGQGLSGLSTLSLASLIAIVSIYLSAYFTAKSMHKKNALIACFIFEFDSKK